MKCCERRDILINMRKPLLCVPLLLASLLFGAPPEKELISVVVTPDHPDWTYEVGEPVQFHVSVERDGAIVPDVPIQYEIGPEQYEPETEGRQATSAQGLTLEAQGMEQPGFLRCSVTATYQGNEYEAVGTAAFAPNEIEPATEEPEDFWRFWRNAIAEVREVPLEPTLEYLPELSDGKVKSYHVSFRNQPRNRIYGILCVPTAPGKYPAILRVPGAGVRSYSGERSMAAAGAITLQIGIHGLPVRYPEETYEGLKYGALYNYYIDQIEDRDRYYYKRVFLGCIKAVDFLETVPAWDGEHIGVTGGSQGGGLSIMTASLHEDIDAFVAFYPAMCDMLGKLDGHAAGWPRLFNRFDAQDHPDWLEVVPYYDGVNFARHLDKPGWMAFGFNDTVVPPTSMFAVYHSFERTPELHLYRDTGHWAYPEAHEASEAWMLDQLGGPGPR